MYYNLEICPPGHQRRTNHLDISKSDNTNNITLITLELHNRDTTSLKISCRLVPMRECNDRNMTI